MLSHKPERPFHARSHAGYTLFTRENRTAARELKRQLHPNRTATRELKRLLHPDRTAARSPARQRDYRRAMLSTQPAAADAAAPFVALGYLSGGTNGPRREKIRQVARRFAGGGVAFRFVLAKAESTTNHESRIIAEARVAKDLVLLNVSDTPFRCALKYVLWFAWARDSFPTAQFLAAGDDDAYVQLAHLEADLRLVRSQIGSAPALWGCIMWRAWYNNVTQDASTGFTGWSCSDAQASSVRQGMEKCESEAARTPRVRRLRSKAELKPDAPTCAAISSNEKRLTAILQAQVDWELPPFPMANGPLFAVSRTLAGMLAEDLELDRDLGRGLNRDLPAVAAAGAVRAVPGPLTPRRWVAVMEARTDLGKRYRQYHDRSRGSQLHKPVELQKRACWPNGDNVLGLYAVWAALRRRRSVTLVHSPVGYQHHPWPVYSNSRSYTNRSIVAHGAKRPSSRMWPAAEARMSGAFIPFNRTCGTCGAEMGWSSYPGSAFGTWQCCGEPLRSSNRTARALSRRRRAAAASGPTRNGVQAAVAA